MAAIHQITAGFRHGDAITNMAREMRRVFSSWGVQSSIFVDTSRVAPTCRSEILPLEEAKQIAENDILILHLSIGNRANQIYGSLPGIKVICYHNVTPAHFFEGLSPAIVADLTSGRKEARALRNIPALCFADSAYNAAELVEMGYKDVKVLPFMMNIEQVTTERSDSIALRLNDGFKNILFVGRCAPNKRIEALIETFYWYNRTINPKSRLIHVGSYDGLEAYHALLLSQVSDLGLREHVWLTGAVSQAELNTFYACADAFLCLSKHEGFCVPLLEAMLHDVAVIASAQAAVPETLDGAGVLLKTDDKPIIAETMHRVIADTNLNRRIREGQRARLQRYKNRNLEAELRELLNPLFAR